MEQENKNLQPDMDSRKADHIHLAFESKTGKHVADSRFYYEPLFSAHPGNLLPEPFGFLGKKLNYPIWVSSMTGGTERAYTINMNLARLCNEFGFGMGLGSCRPLLESSARLKDFDLRPIIGDDAPFFANLGIAQLEELLDNSKGDEIVRLVETLRADGLIIHVNPLQEFMQPEGDSYRRPALETIIQVLDIVKFPVIVKEVGQGMGPASVEALLKLPIAALDFGAFGGTNFSRLELLRSDPDRMENYAPLVYVGHTADEMAGFVRESWVHNNTQIKCKQIIVSGGVENFLHGYALINSMPIPAIYGMASAFLKHATGTYEDLRHYAEMQIRALNAASAFLKVR
jgi:isopentenyl-diphosphate delta-isomerase